jgi:hypothetical protein
MKELTRRQLVFIAAGSAAAAQTTTPDWQAQATQSKRDAATELAKVEIGTSIEPAFEFKP